MIVVDSSVVVDAAAEDNISGDVARERIAREDDLRAPHLVDLEFVSALRRMAARGVLTTGRADAALRSFKLLPLSRHGHGPLLERAWELRSNVKTYDAAYVALAEALGCALLTKDVALSRVRSVRCPVEVLR